MSPQWGPVQKRVVWSPLPPLSLSSLDHSDSLLATVNLPVRPRHCDILPSAATLSILLPLSSSTALLSPTFIFATLHSVILSPKKKSFQSSPRPFSCSQTPYPLPPFLAILPPPLLTSPFLSRSLSPLHNPFLPFPSVLSLPSPLSLPCSFPCSYPTPTTPLPSFLSKRIQLQQIAMAYLVARLSLHRL